MYALINMGDYGLSSDYQYIELTLDSKDATTTQPNVSALDWATFYLTRPIANVAAIKIIQAEIPFSYYVINSTNNTFYLTESGYLPKLVTIPIGNYVSNTFASALGTALTTASGLYTYTVSYATQTQKLSFVSTASPGTTFSFTFGGVNDTGNVNPRFCMGFPAGSTTSNSTPSLTAPSVAQITGPNYVYANSESIGQISNLFLPAGATNLGGGVSGPQFARIPINCNPGDVAFYIDPDPQKWFDLENLTLLSSIDIYFTLGNLSAQTPLLFNGASFSVKIGLLTYKKTNVSVHSGRDVMVGVKRIRG